MKNLKSRSLLVVLLLLTLGSLTAAYAQITPSADAYTNTATPTINLGTKPLLDVESASQTTYIQFDLSSIPAGYTSANVAKATLKLYVNAVTTAGSFNVDFVNGTWSEKTITADLAPALGTTIISGVALTSANVHDYVLIDVTAAVGEWLNGTQANDGLALVGNSPLNASFDSKENTTNSQPAELDIVFTGGGTIAGVTTASGSGLTGGGTSGTLNLSLLNSCSSGQVLQWSGSAWACATGKGTGTITGVTAGTDLTGGGTSGKVTLNLDTTQVPLLNAANVFTFPLTVNSSDPIREGIRVTSPSYGIIATMNSATGTAAVLGQATMSTGVTYGVFGSSSSSSGYGVVGESAGTSTPGVYGTNTASGPGVSGNGTSGTGVYGVSTSGTGVWGDSQGADAVHGVAHSTGGSGVAGFNTTADATAVYGSAPNGNAFVANGHVSQGRNWGGWVKAMAYVTFINGTTPTITRCFNSQIPGSTSSVVPCGLQLINLGTCGSNFCDAVDFGFEVDDRFVALTFTGYSSSFGEFYGLSSDGNPVTTNQVYVSEQSSGFVPISFYVLVY